MADLTQSPEVAEAIRQAYQSGYADGHSEGYYSGKQVGCMNSYDRAIQFGRRIARYYANRQQTEVNNQVMRMVFDLQRMKDMS